MNIVRVWFPSIHCFVNQVQMETLPIYLYIYANSIVYSRPFVFAYNLPGLKRDSRLVLSISNIVDIFTGKIQYWDDSQIQQQNPGIIVHLVSSFYIKQMKDRYFANSRLNITSISLYRPNTHSPTNKYNTS